MPSIEVCVMVSSDSECDGPGGGSDSSALATRRGQTLVIWVLVALGGAGLWVSTLDPIFDWPGAAAFALTVFAFFAALGVAATVVIWRWPGVWERWAQRVPAEGGGRLEAALAVAGLLFWVVAILAVVGTVAFQWHPIATGAVAGGLLVGRLAAEMGLRNWLGRN